MTEPIYDLKAPKKSVNLSLNSDLLRQAKLLGVNLSRFTEEKLVDEVRRRRGEQWRAENQAAIEAYNRRLEETAAATAASGDASSDASNFGSEYRRY
jgi:antitoxin CcdA